MPDLRALKAIVSAEAQTWSKARGTAGPCRSRVLKATHSQPLRATAQDAQQLAHQAIFDDGAITESDVKMVMEAKYRLLEKGGALSFDFDTARLADVAGLVELKIG